MALREQGNYITPATSSWEAAMTLDKLFALSPLDDKDRIAIVMQEYSTLRSEIIARTGLGFQVVAITAATLTWLVQQKFWDATATPLPKWAYGILAFIAICVLVMLLVNVRDTWKAAARLREIELEVNSRAGEHLLIWETLGGAGRMNFWRSLFSRVKRLPRTKLPPLDPQYLERSQQKTKERATLYETRTGTEPPADG